MNIFRKKPVVRETVVQPLSIKTPQFSLKLLSVLHDFETQIDDYTYNGVEVEEILKYMTENFNLDGDIKIQIHIGLQQLLVQGLVVKAYDDNVVKYKLVGPIASVMQTLENTTARDEETQRVLKIFWKDNKSRRNSSSNQSVGRKSSGDEIRDPKCRKCHSNSINKNKHGLEKKKHMQKKLQVAKTYSDSRNEKGEYYLS